VHDPLEARLGRGGAASHPLLNRGMLEQAGRQALGYTVLPTVIGCECYGAITHALHALQRRDDLDQCDRGQDSHDLGI
jgi:hypothetical protein